MKKYGERLERVHETLIAQETMLAAAEAKCEEYSADMEACNERLKTIEAAIQVIQSVSVKMQDDVRNKITSIVQTALDATFPGNKFLMEFVARRDKMDTDMFITDANGNKQDILFGSGGGLKDIVAFALRVAVWSLDKSCSKVIILDEPMKFMSAGCRYQGAELLKVLSEDLGLQFIVVSHVPEIIENGTRVYRIEKGTDEVSRAKIVKENS